MKTVLIVKYGALGDVVRTTSLLPSLKKAYGGPIVWATSSGGAELLKGVPGLGEVVVAGSSRASRLGRDFDLVLSLEEDPKAAALARRCCRGELVGVYARDGRLRYTPSSERFYGMSLLRPRSRGGLRAADRLKAANRQSYARLWLDALGLSACGKPGLRPRVALSDSDRRAARALARRHGLSRGSAIGVNPGAGRRWPAKQLSEAKTASLLSALLALGRPLLLLGGRDERERNRRIAARLPAGAVIRPEPAPVRSFAGILELCAALVAVDSLAFHLATALSVPAVVLVGPTSAAELDVFGRGRVLTPAGGCGCFYRPRCARARHCLSEIPEKRIVSAVRELAGA